MIIGTQTPLLIRQATSQALSRKWWRRSRRRTSSCGLRWELLKGHKRWQRKRQIQKKRQIQRQLRLQHIWLHQKRGHDIIWKHLRYKTFTDRILFSMSNRKLVDLIRWNGLSDLSAFSTSETFLLKIVSVNLSMEIVVCELSKIVQIGLRCPPPKGLLLVKCLCRPLSASKTIQESQI